MIEAKELTKQFIRTQKKGKKEEFYAVDHVSFEAKDGEILGILGPNGAGKTTLLRMLGSLMEPTDGAVVITDKSDEQITKKEDLKMRIGYLSENTKLYGRFTVREMLTIFGELYGYSKEEIAEKIQVISDLLQMDESIENRIDKLSTGQKQRTSIARCLVHGEGRGGQGRGELGGKETKQTQPQAGKGSNSWRSKERGLAGRNLIWLPGLWGPETTFPVSSSSLIS